MIFPICPPYRCDREPSALGVSVRDVGLRIYPDLAYYSTPEGGGSPNRIRDQRIAAF